MKKISFIINASVNTLEYIKLLLTSLKENLAYDYHEILVFVDSDNQGIAEYLRSQKNNFKDLKIITHKVKPCVGYARNSNLLVELASHDIVSYLQSDMVISKNYDNAILEELEENCILSSTRIEPNLHGFSEVTITRNFGLNPQDFKYKDFLEFAESMKNEKTLQYFFAPFTFHKQTWLKYGGYDTLFRRSREDSDLLMRFVHGGVKIKQTFKANVYHFTCISSRGENWYDIKNTEARARFLIQTSADRIELNRFVRKWGAFNHGRPPLKKYDVDLVLKNASQSDLVIIQQIEPFFSRVWIESQELVDALKESVKSEQDPANKLLSFTEEDWQASKKFYNDTDYEEIFKLGYPEKWNAKVELSVENVNDFMSNLFQLSKLIEETEQGTYETESGKVLIDIKKAVLVSKFTVENPEFDMSLLTIE